LARKSITDRFADEIGKRRGIARAFWRQAHLCDSGWFRRRDS
jgi:hypothetical protein